MADVIRLARIRKRGVQPVYFTRGELNQLLTLYSRRVIGGEWKDYAIDQGRGMSAFSIYRDSCNRPLFTIYKFAKGTHRHGNYAVGSGGNILRRAGTLPEALAVFDRHLKLVSG